MTKTTKRKRGRPAGREYTERIPVPVTPEQLARYRASADGMKVPLAEWVRTACDDFAVDKTGGK